MPATGSTEVTLIEGALPRVDFTDSFRASAADESVDSFTALLLASTPTWARVLMRTRNMVVGLVGLKNENAQFGSPPRHYGVGDHVGLFEVFARDEREIVFGANDRHLDFRFSVLVTGGDATVTTIVMFHNAFGRAYFMPVRPFHARIVRSMLTTASARAH